MIQLLIILLIPQTITVRVTDDPVCHTGQTYHTEVIDFQEYVKDVLPNEWVGNWHPEALRAGAVAVKQFAMYEYNVHGFVWGCNWDQVYRTGRRTEATDKAVDDTWNTMLVDNGVIVKPYYDDYPAACYSRGHECMSQWESLRLAEEGWTFDEILLKSYTGELLVLPFSRLDWSLSLLLF